MMPPWQASRTISAPLPRRWSMVSVMVCGLVSVSIWLVATKTFTYHSHCHLQHIYIRVKKKESREPEINYITRIFHEKYYCF